MADFSGKVVLVTGAGKGTGHRLAESFAQKGAIVAANDISPMNVEMLVEQINASGGRAQAFVHDIAKKVALQAMVNEVTDTFGRIDILVNCANVEPHLPILDMDEWDLHRVYEVNAIGAVLTAQVVGRVMRAQGGGIIIETATKARGRPSAAYDSSRASILGLVESAAGELIPHNIRLFGLMVGSGDCSEAVFSLCRGDFAAGTVLRLEE
jgi:NAD(P)-dependent dehydrogenase (short-subunit alcohol dehydrogenase family)